MAKTRPMRKPALPARARLTALAALCSLPMLALVPLATPVTAQDLPAPNQHAPAPAQAPPLATAEIPATLLADRVILTGDDRITAEGAVEVFFRGSRLTATRIVYDRSTDQLTIGGPIHLTEPGQRGTIVLADQAQLSADLRDGILTGARLVLARELQMAANSIRREAGRYTHLDQVVASSCQICADRPTPLWEIRARRVTHDAETRQIHFTGAQFRAAGVPLMYLPHLRMPDPTVERMRGLLRPALRTTSSLGTGIKLPYFFPLGETADLTVTPYVATSWTRTLGLRYRQALRRGAFVLDGAVTRDDIREGETRGYLFGDGVFNLPRDYRLGVTLRLTSDRSYLLNYDITEDDRLWSGMTVDRVRADRMIWGRAGHTHTLRDGETDQTQPSLAGDLRWTRIYRPGAIGGELSVTAGVHAHERASNLLADGPDEDSLADGRDMVRASLVADWRRNWQLGGGILAAAQGELALDAYRVSQDPDPDLNGSTFRALPSAAVELRWPWLRSAGSATDVIEPVAQLIWSRDSLTPVPNDDSLLVEFDEGNLFSLSRFPGADMRERGLRANLGIGWTRQDAAGWSIGVQAGRVWRAKDLDQFSAGSGLDGRLSDWLVAAHLTTAGGMTLSNRALLDDDLSLTRNELRLATSGARHDLAAGLLWMEADPDEGRPTRTSELTFDGGWRWGNGWSTRLETRYDFTAERAARAALGVQYANECVTVDLSLSRRFTSSSSVDPETDIGLSVQLAGFGSSGTIDRARRSCLR